MRLSRGSTGAMVRRAQERLSARGYDLVVDGDFGPRTYEAVRQFQAAQGLAVDGIVGDQTWDALMAAQPPKEPDDVLEEQLAWLFGQIPAELDGPRRAVLVVACQAFGLEEVPDGSNGGPQIAHIVGDLGEGASPRSGYYVQRGVALDSMPPWCAIMVSWALREGLEAESWADIPFGEWFGGVAEICDWANKRACYHQRHAREWPAGAIFTMGRSHSGSDAATTSRAGHTGFVVADDGDGVITVEGNTGNGVRSRRRKKSDLDGYVTWWTA